jgi:hypothetical protein
MPPAPSGKIYALHHKNISKRGNFLTKASQHIFSHKSITKVSQKYFLSKCNIDCNIVYFILETADRENSNETLFIRRKGGKPEENYRPISFSKTTFFVMQRKSKRPGNSL